MGARGSRARKRCESKRRDASQHDAQDQRRNPPGPHVEARTSRQRPTGRHKSRPPNGPQHSLCSFTVRSPRMLSIRARPTDVAASTLHGANGKVNGPDRQVWSLRSPNLASRSNARPRACENGDCNTRDHARGSAIATVVRAGIKSAVLIGTKTDPTLRTADFPDERASEPAARTRSPWTKRSRPAGTSADRLVRPDDAVAAGRSAGLEQTGRRAGRPLALPQSKGAAALGRRCPRAWAVARSAKGR